jgi:protein involved in plasmid replication-relaxation
MYVLHEQLTDKHRAIIKTLSIVRVASSNQLKRLHFVSGNSVTQLRMCNYTLTRMTDLGILIRRRRPNGGLGGGSEAFYYALDRPGQAIAWPDRTTRGKYWEWPEPDPAYVRHRLGVTEVYVVCREAAKAGFSLQKYEPEPICWRRLPMHTSRKVRPDAYVSLTDGRRMYRWFIEVDMGTEWPKRIDEKLKIYYRYYQSGHEQYDLKGVFPKVLWLVSDQGRKQQMEAVISRRPPEAQRLFQVELQEEMYQALIGMQNGIAK